MIRVTRIEDRTSTILAVDGQLSAESVCVVETCFNQADSHGKPIEIFLRDVTTVDEAGRMLLKRFAANGVRLKGRGVYTSYLVDNLMNSGTAQRPTAISDAASGESTPRVRPSHLRKSA